MIFKRVMVDGGNTVNIELYEPFKKFYEETKCSVTITETIREGKSYILEPSDGRWLRYRRTMERIAEALIKLGTD